MQNYNTLRHYPKAYAVASNNKDCIQPQKTDLQSLDLALIFEVGSKHYTRLY